MASWWPFRHDAWMMHVGAESSQLHIVQILRRRSPPRREGGKDIQEPVTTRVRRVVGDYESAMERHTRLKTRQTRGDAGM